MTIFRHGNLGFNYPIDSVRGALGLDIRNSRFCQHIHSQTTLYWYIPCAQRGLVTSKPYGLINRYEDITLQIPIALSPELAAP